MSFTIGATVGPYEIREKLGKGGMATVYKAYHAKLERFVAIKVLHATFHDDDSFLRRFAREAKVVAKLEHPHIVPVYDFAEHDGYPYLVMRYIAGQTLKDRLRQGAIPRGEMERIATAIARGLDYAHRQGVLHRDIKPSNILLTASGGVYITDFGLARMTQAGESTLSQDMIMGTPQYISPEQAKGDKDLDGRTDVYSFGILLYEMATGQVPFQADTGYSIIHSQIFDDPPPPSTLNQRINPALESVLLRALRKEPNQRFDTAGDLVNAFNAALTEMPAETQLSGGYGLPDDAPDAGDEKDGDQTAVPSPTLNPPPLPDLSDAPSSQITPRPGPAAEEKPKQKQRRPLLYMVGGAAIGMFLCLCVFLVLINRDNQNNANNPPPAQGFVPPATTDLSLDELNTQADQPNPDPQVLALLAQAYLENDNPGEARRIVRRVFDRVATPEGYITAAEKLLENGDDALAAVVLEEGVQRLETDDPQLYELLLLAYILNQTPANTIRSLVTELNNQHDLPDKTPITIGAAYLSYERGEVAEAAQMLQTALAKTENFDEDIYFLLGAMYANQGLTAEAEAAWQNALDANPAPWLRQRIEMQMESVE